MNRQRLAALFIACGVLCFAAAIGYEAVNFPWRLYIGPIEHTVSAPRPPEPTLADVEFVPWQPEMTAPPAAGDGQIVLPGSDTWVSPAATAPPAPAGQAEPSAPQPALPQYAVMGAIAIPILGVSENIISGTEDQLRAGVGHMPETALPGETGNCALAGHRNYIRMHPFRHLDKLKVGDRVVVTFGEETYTYTVYEAGFVVPDDAVWVVQPVPDRDKTLTLITCDPVVNPVNRLIVRAELTDG